MPASRLLIALGVILFGFCAALPFRQPNIVRAVVTPAEPRVELPLRKPEPPPGLVQAEDSPAAALSRGPDITPLAPRQAISAESPLDALTSVAPPPVMPIAFQPVAEDIRPTSWKPAQPAAAVRPPKLRPYRLRDGDTLERLAERYLGDKSRADEIFASNRHVLTQPDLLPVGVEIMLPPRQTAAAN